MNNTPRNIRTALDQRVCSPLVEALAGLRPVHTLDELVTPAITVRLTQRVHPARSVKVLDVKAQVAPGTKALEAFATVNVDGVYHALAVRVEVRNGRQVIVNFETTI